MHVCMAASSTIRSRETPTRCRGTLRKAHHRFVRTFLLVQALFIRDYQRGDHCVTPSFTWTGLCDLDKPGVSLNIAVVWMEVLLHKHDDLAQL